MLIEYVELQNFKSYLDARIDFAPGTNAIIGENGAGKSSLLQAIGFALFGHRRGKLADCLREGAKRGSVVVGLVSSLDERRYEVERRFTSKTTLQYRVYDPELGRQCLAEGASDVGQWVRDHLRLPKAEGLDIRRVSASSEGPHSDLSTLFENTIGVPQGTFTMPFLLPAGQRKAVFDPLLRVEEYRKASDNLRGTVRHLKVSASDLRAETARMEGQLSALPGLRDERAALDSSIERLRLEIVVLSNRLSGLEDELRELDQAKDHVQKADQHAREAHLRLDSHEALLESAQRAMEEAEQAEIATLQNRPGHEAYLAANRELQKLEESRRKRDRLLSERGRLQAQVARLESVRDQERRLLTEIADAQSRVSEVEKGLQQASRIEERLVGLGQQINERRALLAGAQASRAATLSEIERLAKQSALLGDVPLGCLRPKTVVCPTCESELTPQHRQEILARNGTETKQLKAKAQEAEKQQRAYSQAISGLQKTQTQERARLRSLPSQHDLSRSQREIQARQQALAASHELLAGHNNLSSVPKMLERVESNLAPFAGLERDLKRLQAQRSDHEKTHGLYLANLRLAGQRSPRQARLDGLLAKLSSLKRELNRLAHEYQQARSSYDPDEHAQVKDQVGKFQRNLAAAQAQLKEKRERFEVATRSIGKLETMQKDLEAKAAKLKETQKLERMIERIRELLREAGPHITHRLVRRISQGASVIYGDLVGDTGARLQWSDDYELSLEVHGRRRNFGQLSGGERMCAALALRLALLRESSMVDVAFFDEPTAHLDPERRQSLAEGISRVKGFSQMFVISHDDTFEATAQNAVHIVKDERGSHANSG